MVRAAHLVEEENQRLAELEEVKQKLRGEVQQSIERNVESRTEAERLEVAAVARGLKQKTLSEVGESERELERARTGARIGQFVNYVFFVVYGVIGLTIVLELLGARDRNGFMRFLGAVSAPFLAPFKGLLFDPAVGSSQLMLSYVMALVVYGLLHWAVRGLLRVLAFRETRL